MLKIRQVIIVLGMLSCSMSSSAEVSIGIGLPNVSIGINLPTYPELVAVPGYPVYYAPQMEANFFFYDGMYWVYQNDNWYASSWYNGPWGFVDPEIVPIFLLQIPVRYYRHPPAYFRGWGFDAPPRWGEHWGRDWEQRRSGWDRRDRSPVPATAPASIYQRQYSRDRYPRQMEQQQELQQRNYPYQPRDPVVRQHAVQGAPVQQDIPAVPRAQSPQTGGHDFHKPTPDASQQGRVKVQDHQPPPQPAPDQRRQQVQGQPEKHQGRDATHEPKPGQEQERGRDRNQ
jgi:hypothetical protein